MIPTDPMTATTTTSTTTIYYYRLFDKEILIYMQFYYVALSVLGMCDF